MPFNSKDNITLGVGDIEIGAVELKDSTTNNRSEISAAGHLQVDVSAMPVPTPSTSCGNFLLDIPAAGVADRTQITAQACIRVTIQAKSTNALRIFIGGSTVTNQLGINEGIELDPGDTSSPIELSNCNLLYVSTETAGNDIKVFWEL